MEQLLEEAHEVDDNEESIVFPSGKSVVEREYRKPKPTSKRGGEKKNVAKGNYKSPVSPPKKRRAAPIAVVPSRTPLQSGIFKLVEASVRYHPDKDSVLKQGFLGERLTPPELKEMLRRLFHIKLTEPELSAVFAHFVPDGGMELDGNRFIIHFIQVHAIFVNTIGGCIRCHVLCGSNSRGFHR